MTIDDEQLAWFEETVAAHPAEEGWKIFCFSHAPIIGSGLRVLQASREGPRCRERSRRATLAARHARRSRPRRGRARQLRTPGLHA